MNIDVAGEEFRVHYANLLSGVDAVEPFITFDTETTGLHIKKDRPFLAAVCSGHDVYVFPPNVENLQVLVKWSKKVKRVYGHNVTYDMHMMANQDVDPLRINNWGDTMCLVRLTVEAKSTRHGGDKIGLKDISKKYIDSTSDRYEKAVKSWLHDKRAQDKKVLSALLKPIRHPEHGSWTVKKLEDALEEGSVPVEVIEIYQRWLECYPVPTYADVPLDIMVPYLAMDVILTQLLVLKCLPILVHRKQMDVVEREFKLLPVVYKMECNGLKVDREYLLQSHDSLSNYIIKMYKELHEITGLQFSVGQHLEIKKMYTDLLGEEPASTDKKFLKKLERLGGVTGRSAVLISRIRRFEKWLATYIDRILTISAYDGRYYTQLNQFSPVSGRFSGDAQQFPKDPIYTEEGYQFEKSHPNESVPNQFILYHPRRAFIERMYYVDYSQVELRMQSHYTLAFGGDTNLCRAYMPFRCRHYKTGEIFDHTSVSGRVRWSEQQLDGESVWIDEENKSWTETDVHMATTLKALIAMGYDPTTMDEDLIKWWRKKGKTFNFMRNYGGGDFKAAETLEIELEQAKALNKGYTDAFPTVVTYQGAVINRMRQNGYCVNLYGRRYYLSDWNKHYAVGNYLIQGSSADLLKQKMIEIDQFIVGNQLEDKIRMVLCVHDELVFEEIVPGQEWAIRKIKHIMEDTPNIQVPIIAEVEYTETNWAEKKELHI